MPILKSNGNADSNFISTVLWVTICSMWFVNFALSQCPRGTQSSTLPCVNGVCAAPQVCNNATGMCCARCGQRQQLRRLSLQLNRIEQMNRGNPFLSRANFRQWRQSGRWGQGRGRRTKRNIWDGNISILTQELMEQQKAIQIEMR